MESVRFFVSGLPADCTEADLKRVFQDYGAVCDVDLKNKKNLVDDDDVKIIAFVTLKLNPNDVRYCLNELNWKKIRGAKLTVHQAKESFLERLKREREEAEAVSSGDVVAQQENTSSLLLGHKAENQRKVFADDEEFNDDDIEPSLLITKKRAAGSMRNGKIVIQSFDATPIHVIEAKKPKNRLDEKSLSADQKRKESLNKMKNDYQQKKLAIQAALTGSANKFKSNKIRFSDSEDEDMPKKKLKMFGSDDEGEGEEFDLKAEHFTKKGGKLAHMQSKQSLDPRFKIDAKFVDEDEYDDNDYEHGDGEDERNWQMGILQQVVGTNIDTSNAVQKKAKNKKMLHFDPSKEDHQKFIRNETAQAKTTPSTTKTKTKQSTDNNNADDGSAPAKHPTSDVSREVFYVVTDTLAESFKTADKGFSLLSMFGRGDHMEERNDQLQKLSSEKILVNKFEPNALAPFSHDACSDSDEEKPRNAAQHTDNKKQKKKVTVESFFIPRNDVRLKEGAKFFRYDKDKSDENYEEVRNRLRTIIKTKIAKTKKNLAATGVKSRKKKRTT